MTESLIEAIKNRPQEQTELLAKYKKEWKELYERCDFIWFILLQSFSTMGNSRWYHGLIGNKENYNQVDYRYICNIPADQLEDHLATVLWKAKKKAHWLKNNFDTIQPHWWVEEVKKIAENTHWTVKKIAFLKNFQWIWDKYARNIRMDVYHDDFHNTIALDERIRKISKALGLWKMKYPEEENIYLDILKRHE